MSVGHLSVPGAGIEPARIAPLVFETSASTDSAIRAGVLCPKTGTRRIDLLVKDCKGIGNFGNCKINDIPWTENPIELTKVELKTFYNSEYHGTLDGNIRESVQGICCQVCSVRCVRPGMFRLRAFFSCPPLSRKGYSAKYRVKCSRSSPQSGCLVQIT